MLIAFLALALGFTLPRREETGLTRRRRSDALPLGCGTVVDRQYDVDAHRLRKTLFEDEAFMRAFFQ